MRYILSIFLFTVASFAIAGGGWTYKKGAGYFKIDQSVISANRFFAPNGDVVDITTISLYTTSLYAEYGLTDKWTAIAYVPFFVRSTLNEVRFRQSGNVQPGDEVNAFGDTNIGLKYGFFQDKPIVVATSLTFGLPLGETEGGDSKILQTGDGEFNQLLKIEASHSFYPKPIYASLVAGFNNRTSGFSDEVHIGGELGYSFPFGLTVIGKIYNVSSLFNGGAGDPPLSGVFSNNTEYLSFGPEIGYSPNKKVGISAAAGLAASGKRILAAPNYSAGIYISL